MIGKFQLNPAELLTFLDQALALLIAQVKLLARGIKLLLENPVWALRYLMQIINHLLLYSIHPTPLLNGQGKRGAVFDGHQRF